MAKSRQKGFTIIELIVVILLLGILTATALPRFLDVTDEAHAAVASAVAGGLQTGNALFRAGYIASGQPAAGTVVPTFGDGTLAGSADGYPAGLTGETVIADSADCINIYKKLLQDGSPTIEETGTDAAFTTASIAAAGTDAQGNVADFNAIFSAGAVAPYAANSCYFVYTAQYATETLADAASADIPVIVYQRNGQVFLTDHNDSGF